VPAFRFHKDTKVSLALPQVVRLALVQRFLLAPGPTQPVQQERPGQVQLR
jgi:hypothetical protein